VPAFAPHPHSECFVPAFAPHPHSECFVPAFAPHPHSECFAFLVKGGPRRFASWPPDETPDPQTGKQASRLLPVFSSGAGLIYIKYILFDGSAQLLTAADSFLTMFLHSSKPSFQPREIDIKCAHDKNSGIDISVRFTGGKEVRRCFSVN
jgi:hypothetical protein